MRLTSRWLAAPATALLLAPTLVAEAHPRAGHTELVSATHDGAGVDSPLGGLYLGMNTNGESMAGVSVIQDGLEDPAGDVASAAAVTDAPRVSLAVAMDRMVFPDGVYSASFSAHGACLSSTSEVQVVRAMCGQPDAPDITEGEIRTAMLGFVVHRSVEAAPVDLPIAQTAQGSAPQQLHSVRVDLETPGALTVHVTGIQEDGVNPAPVPGTASAGGEISGRSVTWKIGQASAGSYVFSVQFSPNAPPAFDGTFVPQVDIELASQAATLIDYSGGSVPAAATTQRTATLSMRQLVAPGYGPPGLSVSSFSPAVAGEPYPNTWQHTASLDARGNYLADASGHVSADADGQLQDLAPGALGVVNSAWSLGGSLDYYVGETKAASTSSFDFLPDGKPSGFHAGIRTSSTVPELNPLGAGVGGTIWDGDAVVFGRAIGIHTIKTDRSEPPQGPQGTFGPDWSGEVVRPWTGSWFNWLPGGEPNAVNPYANMYLLGPTNSGLDYGYRVLHEVGATIPMVARGDIDNRFSGSELDGAPMSFSVPSGQKVRTVGILTISIPATQFKTKFQWTSDRTGFTLTPSMGAGGYWLRSSGQGYDRDWTNVTTVLIESTDKNPSGPAESRLDVLTSGSVVVPRGAVADLRMIDADNAIVRSATLRPGLWSFDYDTGAAKLTVTKSIPRGRHAR